MSPQSLLCPMCERVGYPVNDCPTCTALQWLCSCDYWNIGGICTHCGKAKTSRYLLEELLDQCDMMTKPSTDEET